MFAVIDVGSNSVRLMLHDGIKTISKDVDTTQLAEGLSKTSMLNFEAVERTARAVSFFVAKAINLGVKPYVFATAAVRQAKNGTDFVKRVKDLCGIDVDVVDGLLEAKLGVLGALNGQVGGIIDIGGASTEILVSDGNKIEFIKSFNVGAVRIKDQCGQNEKDTDLYIKNQIAEVDSIPKTIFYGIGGTVTCISAMLQNLVVYNPNKTDGYVIKKSDVFALKKKLFTMSIDDRRKMAGLHPKRAEIIAHGVSILYALMDKYSIDQIITSEKDNLEGYLLYKRGLK